VGPGIHPRRIVLVKTCVPPRIVRHSVAAGEQALQNKSPGGETALNRDYHNLHRILAAALRMLKND